MRWSNAFIPTLREEPAKTESISHKLLLRAGMIRLVGSGIYSLLPLGQKVRKKIISIIVEEMNAIGAQEFLLPALVPAEIWQESGRWDTMGAIMFRLKDRKDADIALGVTHEEVFASIAANNLSSYRQVPQMWYQVQTKFRDEPRPRAGLLRVREFTMKDSYSFDVDDKGLDKSFDLHRDAYIKIFERCNVKFVMAGASSGIMGGAQSTEFLAVTDAGEDRLVICESCGYAANMEKAVSNVPAIKDDDGTDDILKFATPNVRTIEALTTFPGGAPAERQIKTLIYVAEGNLVAILVRGDHELNVTAVADYLKVPEIRPATPDEVLAALGALPGSLGAVIGSGGIAKTGSTAKGISKFLGDKTLSGRKNMVTGANEDDFHYRNVSVERDIRIDEWGDFRMVQAGDKCNCGQSLSITNALEIGHIFKLGTKYSEAFGAHVLLESGEKTPLVMGSYGIGAERLMAAVIEQSHDDKGIIWPVSVAPYDVVITPVNVQDEAQMNYANSLYEELRKAGFDPLLDDRDERAGVKFNDSDLIGIPYRITVGKKLTDNKVELFTRATKQVEEVETDEVLDKLKALR